MENEVVKNSENVSNLEADCVVCKIILNGRKKFKCDECELNVCYSCHKKTYINKEWFMCQVCQ